MPGLTCPHCRKFLSAPAAVCPHCQKPIRRGKAPRWYLARQKKSYGPYTLAQLRLLAARGDLTPDDWLLKEGTKQWFRAGALDAAFASQAPARPASRWLLAGMAGFGICVVLAISVLAGSYFLGRNQPPAAPLADPGPVAEVGIAKADAPQKNSGDKNPPLEQKPALPSPSARWMDQFVEGLNRQRRVAGLGSVAFDSELSRACLAHARYLAQHVEPGAAEGVNDFAEDPAKPGYSVEGERAGEVASIAFAEPLPALEGWMSRVKSRTLLLDPEMRSIGLGFAQTAAGAWVSVLDAQRGRGDLIIVYPGPKQADVPLSCSGGPELPDPKTQAGFPITVVFPPGQDAAAGGIELRDDKGKEVEGWLWTPQKPVQPGFQRNALALIPKATLRPGCVYQVKAAAQVGDKKWGLAWSFTTEDDADSKGLWSRKALAKVNQYRAQAGLQPVVLDDPFSRGCLAHARYMAINEGHPALQGLKAHDEDLSLPGSSKEGQAAGNAADIATGDYEPTDAVDAWMATLYHRVPILEPNLQAIGFGCARGRRFGWVTVMNVVAGRAKGPRPHPVFYPVADQIDVPLSFPNGGEEPNPIPDDTDGKAGYPVTAVFPRDKAPTNALGKLTDGAGKAIPCWFSSPEKPANPTLSAGFQGTTICLIAKDPLKPNTTYHVHLQGQLVGEPWQKQWKFTTGDAGATVAQASRQVVDRLNHYRSQAGLAPVVRDDSLGVGCQLHAEYLVKQADLIQKTNASVNDEDPLLPGFTAEGRRSAKRSDVFTNSPIPVMQIDDLMATFTRRVRLLDPAMQRIGFGCAHEIGRGWRCVLDLNAGRGDARVIRYPAPDQEDVPCVGFDRPKPSGFPISVTFPKQANVRKAQALLSLDGADVEVSISSLEKPVAAKSSGTTLGIYPLEPLQPGRTYTVTISAIVDAAEWRQEWKFTTAVRRGKGEKGR